MLAPTIDTPMTEGMTTRKVSPETLAQSILRGIESMVVPGGHHLPMADDPVGFAGRIEALHRAAIPLAVCSRRLGGGGER